MLHLVHDNEVGDLGNDHCTADACRRQPCLREVDVGACNTSHDSAIREGTRSSRFVHAQAQKEHLPDRMAEMMRA